MMAGILRTGAVGGAAVMNEHSLLAEDQKFVAPICCSECDDNAHLIDGRLTRSRVWKYAPLNA